MGVFPHTEDLDLNVRRALKELIALPEQRVSGRSEELKESTICANAEPAEGLSRAPTPVSTPNQYVVDCVDGKIRVIATPLCHAKAGMNTETAKASQTELFSSMVNTPVVNRTSDVNTSLSRSPSSVLASSYASCSSTTDGESEIFDLSGIDMRFVATWAQQSPRSTSAPHPRFYFTDGTLELQVQDSLYKVHHHFFEHYSTFFVAIFTTLRTDGTQTSSSVADSIIQLCNPIHLPDITSIDFDRLLTIIYPSSFAYRDITSMEEWISVLNLSCKLEFASIRDLAIDNIAPKASIMDKAILGKRCAIKSWIMDAYIELCTRERPLSIEEGRRLGIDLVIKINELRHELFYRIRTDIGMSCKPGLEIGIDSHTSIASTREFEELPERVVQHFKLHTMDDGVPEDDGIYFKMVLDANQ